VVPIAGTTLNVEVDVFHGDNEGLVLAEIELPSEDYVFEVPEWLGKEVTGDPRYYNSYISAHPFNTWQE
jgi:CYTH domain-containing protein